MNIEDLIKSLGPLKPFDPKITSPFVNPISGDVTMIWEDVPCFHEWVNLTYELIRSNDDNRVIGVHLNGDVLSLEQEQAKLDALQ